MGVHVECKEEGWAIVAFVCSTYERTSGKYVVGVNGVRKEGQGEKRGKEEEASKSIRRQRKWFADILKGGGGGLFITGGVGVLLCRRRRI